MRMLKSTFRHWLSIGAAVTLICGLVYIVAQQSLRQGANDPQIQMAEDAAEALTGGGTAESVLPAARIDPSRSLAPFVIVYGGDGSVLASSAALHGQTPGLPAGVFESVRRAGEDRVTWQPEPGVRIAAVVTGYGGSQPGFVLAGRSLREVEARTGQIGSLVLVGWLASLAATLIAVAALEVLFAERKTAS